MRIASSLFCCAWLAGCVLPQKESLSERPLSARSLGLGNQAAPVYEDRWWHALGDPQLDSLIERALADNPDLGQALARMRAAAAQQEAASARLRPSETFDANEVYQRFSENYYFPPPFGGGTYWLGQIGPNFRWNIDFWGRQADLIHAAASRAGASLLEHAAARLAIESAVVQAYIDLDRAYAFDDIAVRAQDQREELLRLTRQRVESGLDTRIELKLAEASLPQARALRLRAQSDRDLAAHRLAELTGAGAGSYSSIARPHLVNASLPVPSALPIDLLARRPDVLASLTRIDAAHAERAAARAAFYPEISLSAFAGVQAIGLDSLFKSGSGIYGAGPEVHLPIFDARRLRAEYRGRTVEVDDAIASYNAVVLRAVRETADQLTLSESYRLQIDHAQQALASSEEALRLSKERYGAGLGTQLTVLNAESQVLNSRRDLKSAESGCQLAKVNLLLALGGSFHPPLWAQPLAAAVGVEP